MIKDEFQVEKYAKIDYFQTIVWPLHTSFNMPDRRFRMSSEAVYLEDPSARAVSDIPAALPDKGSDVPNKGVIESREASDEHLLDLVREGDREALARLFRRYAHTVRSVARRILRDDAEADDLVQEVFIFIFRKAALYDSGRGAARSWLVQVTYHRAIDRRRHLASRNFYASAELDETLFAVDGPITDAAFYERSIEGALGTEMLSRIEEALSIDQRRTIQLFFFDGYTFEEIAKLTGQMVGNVRNHYYRGLEKIRKLIYAPELREK
jgi:RNA polymerase sigma-70 factor (ECF subfamily)